MSRKTTTNTENTNMPAATKGSRRTRTRKSAPKKEAAPVVEAAPVENPRTTEAAAPAVPAASEPAPELAPEVVEANAIITDLMGLVDTMKAENARLRSQNRELLSSVEVAAGTIVAKA